MGGACKAATKLTFSRRSPDSASLESGGATTTLYGFDELQMQAGLGGADRASLFDSPDDDHVRIQGGSIEMYSGGVRVVAVGFERVFAWSSAGWQRHRRSARHERRTTCSPYCPLTPTSPALATSARSRASRRVEAVAARGGADRALLYDGPGDDRFAATAQYANFRGAGFHNSVAGSGQRASGGEFWQETIEAALYGGIGQRTFGGQSSGRCELSHDSLRISAEGFEEVVVDGGAGSVDAALLTGSLPSRSTCFDFRRRARLTNDDVSLTARGFRVCSGDGRGRR